MPIIAYQPTAYDHYLPQAQHLIGARDPKDVDILALALALNAPLWSSDRDFEGIPNLTLLKNDAVQNLLEASHNEEVADNNP
jgi:predicted nucleic acid-binding protein